MTDTMIQLPNKVMDVPVEYIEGKRKTGIKTKSQTQ